MNKNLVYLLTATSIFAGNALGSNQEDGNSENFGRVMTQEQLDYQLALFLASGDQGVPSTSAPISNHQEEQVMTQEELDRQLALSLARGGQNAPNTSVSRNNHKDDQDEATRRLILQLQEEANHRAAVDFERLQREERQNAVQQRSQQNEQAEVIRRQQLEEQARRDEEVARALLREEEQRLQQQQEELMRRRQQQNEQAEALRRQQLEEVARRDEEMARALLREEEQRLQQQQEELVRRRQEAERRFMEDERRLMEEERARSRPTLNVGESTEQQLVVYKENEQRHFYIPCEVNGHSSTFMFDSGATRTVIPIELCEQFGIDTNGLNYTHQVGTGNGATNYAECHVDCLKVGQLGEFRNVRLLVTENPEQSPCPILGEDVTDNFDCHKTDQGTKLTMKLSN